jgi:hypothetical protein
MDAGTARQGPRAGEDRYTICQDLYACMVRTGCGASTDPGYCLCGADSVHCDAGGPCAKEELGALESLTDPASIVSAVEQYKTLDPKVAGFCAHALNNVYGVGVGYGCFADAGP